MILDKLLVEAKEYMRESSEKYGTPSPFYVDFIDGVGQRLCDELGGDKKIVSLGISFMDSMLGPALECGKLENHVAMAEEKTKEFLDKYSQVGTKERENIISCVREHHGVKDFYSIESEICCNADCYKFLSIEGVIGGIYRSREMSISEFVELYRAKAEEKWKASSLDICRKELKSQYEAIKNFFDSYKES